MLDSVQVEFIMKYLNAIIFILEFVLRFAIMFHVLLEPSLLHYLRNR